MTILDSKPEELRKQLPRGDGAWPEYATVYGLLRKAADSNPRSRQPSAR